jgi:secreted Zn-dependent insulinase-like peptidase
MMRISSLTSYTEFTKIYKNIQKSFYVVSQFYGNMNEKQLLKIESFIQPFLNQDVNLVAKGMNVEDDKVLDYLHYHKNFTGSYVYRTINDMPTEVNNAIINYFQVGKRDLRNSLIMNLIELSWENLFFYNLRTVKQLGYIVAASKYVKDNYMYYLFLVQGSKITPEKMNIEIDEVLKLVRTKLEELEEDQLNDYKDTLIAELNKKNNNLKERSEVVWKEIYENSLDFNRRYKLIEELKSITIEDLIQHFVETFYTNVRKMSIQVYSQFKFDEALMSTKPIQEIYYLNQDVKTIISDEYDLLKYTQ